MTAPRAKHLNIQSKKSPLPKGRRPDMTPHLIICMAMRAALSCLFCWAKQAALSREGRELGVRAAVNY